jgi:hypothetical protein
MGAVQALDSDRTPAKLSDRAVSQRSVDPCVPRRSSRQPRARREPQLPDRGRVFGDDCLGVRGARPRRQLVSPPTRTGVHDDHDPACGTRAPGLTRRPSCLGARLPARPPLDLRSIAAPLKSSPLGRPAFAARCQLRDDRLTSAGRRRVVAQATGIETCASSQHGYLVAETAHLPYARSREDVLERGQSDPLVARRGSLG